MRWKRLKTADLEGESDECPKKDFMEDAAWQGCLEGWVRFSIEDRQAKSRGEAVVHS